MIEMLSYAFMQRAFITGLLVSICASLLGVSLVLRRYSMIGDGLSHVGFGALAVATVFSFAPMLFTMPVVIVAAILLLRLNEKSRSGGDAAIAIISSSALAIGVVLVSYMGTNTDLNNFLFGSLLAVSKSDALFSIVLAIVVIACCVLLYERLYAVTFDPAFARASSINTGFYTTLLAVLAALTIVLGMRMLGSLLVSALIIFPSLGAMRVAKSYRAVMLVSLCESVICFVLGLSASYFFGTPTGASIVVVHLFAFLIFAAVGALMDHGLINKKSA